MTPHTPTAVLLSPRPSDVRAAREVGARSLVLASDLSSPHVREAALAADEALAVDWRDHPRLLDAISHFADSPLRSPALAPRASVFGFGEAAALVAARANEALGLPGNPHAAVAYLTDKAALRDRVNQLTATPVRFERCDRAADLVPAASRVGFPCVVKPRTGSGGEGVHRLHGVADAEALARQLAPESALIIEEDLQGPEYTAEAHSRAGRHTVLAVTRRYTTGVPDCVDTGYDLPAGLGKRTLSKVHKLVAATLDAAGHRTGPSHTEIIITSSGPRLVESHAHPGSDHLSDLLQLATGTDRIALTFATVLGLPEPAPQPRDRYAGVRFLPLSVAEMRHSMHSAQEARNLPGVAGIEIIGYSDSHAPAATSRAAGHGVLTAIGSSPQELAEVFHSAVDTLCPALGPAHRATPAPEATMEEELSAV
ncbi:ATP-grasp domain-containing protein [Streptomyces sp. ACA25]|uniref:ATP-grasp domain-containing protein n=1 Tax=Streptomyces sp. ACA25 TaxID=3022596 RepID=UPI0023074633|nr:ATP-grasp domain-containing protein [Streptomyces sp. ACA25]MDB1089484.1 ATP-grasp domain-containing protein [Streptomyces sp. ACA25]